MRILRWALVVLVVVLVAAELGGRIAVERIATDRIRESGIAGEIDVTVGRSWWRPTVVPALFGGQVDRAEVRLRDADVNLLAVRSADYVIEGLDVAISIRHRTIGATDLDRGTYRLSVDPADIGAGLGVAATAEDDRLLVGPDRDPATLAVEGSDLVVTSEAFAQDGGSMRLPVVDPSVLPCTPDVRVAGGLVELWCSSGELPGILRTPLGTGASGDDPGDVPSGPVELEPPASVELAPSTTGG